VSINAKEPTLARAIFGNVQFVRISQSAGKIYAAVWRAVGDTGQWFQSHNSKPTENQE
jgi:hypothetical protein